MAPTAQEKLLLKTSFKATTTLESFYTGGPLALSQDESTLFCADGEHIHVVDAANGKKLYTIKGDTESITAITPTPDGTRLLTASRSQMLRLWSLPALPLPEEGKVRATILRQWKAHEAPVLVADCDSTSTYAATGSADGSIHVWDLAKGFATHLFRPAPGAFGVIGALRFNPHASGAWTLYSGGEDGMVRCWDLKSSRLTATLQGHVSVVRSLAFTRDGKRLVSGARDQVMIVWDLASGSLLRTVPVYETIESVGILEDDVTIVTAGEKGILRCWNMGTGEEAGGQVAELNAKHTYVDAKVISEGTRVMAITNDQNILFFTPEASRGGKVILGRERQLLGYHDEVLDMLYVGPGETHLAVATNSEQVRIIEVATSNSDLLYGHADIVLCMDAWPADGTAASTVWYLATGSKDKTARVWRLDFGTTDPALRFTCVSECVGHAEAIGAVALHAPEYILTGSQDRTVKRWSLAPALMQGAPTAGAPPSRLPSEWTQHAHDKDINSLAIAPTGQIFASASQDKSIKVWSAEEGKLLGTCLGHKRGVWSVKFSPVDKVMATSSGDKSVRLWSLSDFSCLKTFEGHTNTVLRVAFLSSGLQLASSASDGLVKIWNVRGEECATTLDNHTEKVWALAVRRDEQSLASGGADAVINIWTDTTEAEREEETEKREALILQEQRLANMMATHDWRNALLLALQLGQPKKLLGLFWRMIDDAEAEAEEVKAVAARTTFSGSAHLDDALRSLPSDQLTSLLGYIRDWNTNGKTARIAQIVLYTLLNLYSPEVLEATAGYKEVVEALIPFTERHFGRVEQLLVDSYLIDYTLQAMDQAGLGGVDVEEEEEEEEEDAMEE